MQCSAHPCQGTTRFLVCLFDPCKPINDHFSLLTQNIQLRLPFHNISTNFTAQEAPKVLLTRSIPASWQPFLYCNNQGNTMYASCSNGECYPVCSNEMAGVRINQTHAAIFGGYSSTLIDFVDKLWIWDSNRLRFVFETSNPNLTRTASTGWVSSDDGRFTIWGGSRGTDNGNMLSAAIATTPWSWQYPFPSLFSSSHEHRILFSQGFGGFFNTIFASIWILANYGEPEWYYRAVHRRG